MEQTALSEKLYVYNNIAELVEGVFKILNRYTLDCSPEKYKGRVRDYVHTHPLVLSGEEKAEKEIGDVVDDFIVNRYALIHTQPAFGKSFWTDAFARTAFWETCLFSVTGLADLGIYIANALGYDAGFKSGNISFYLGISLSIPVAFFSYNSQLNRENCTIQCEIKDSKKELTERINNIFSG